MNKTYKVIHCTHAVLVMFIIITVFLCSLSFAGGRKGSHLVGGIGSSHKGGHYVGGTTTGRNGGYSSGRQSSGGYSSGGYNGSSSISYYIPSSPRPTYSTKRHYRSNIKHNKHNIIYHKYKSTHTWSKGVKRDENGRIVRSESAKKDFLRMKGLNEIPSGMNIDHIIPLYAGGCDCPENMQLLTIEEHHRKTKADYKKYPR